MKSHFANFLEIEFAASERLARREIANDIGAAATKGVARSGRLWLVLEGTLAKNLHAFGEGIITKFDSLDPEHSPFDASDFNLAKESVRNFRIKCEEIHAEQRGRLNTHPISRQPFEDGHLDRIEAKVLNEIEGRLATFMSKRSFIKWALGDLRKRIWSGGLVLLGTAIGSTLIPAIRKLTGV